MRPIRRAFALPLAIACTGCIVLFQSGSIERSDRSELRLPRDVASPLKAFYLDGSSAVFPDGARITDDSIIGRGTLYAVDLADATPVTALAMESLVGIEAFQGETNAAASVVASLGLTAAAFVGSAALAVAIFGSCPTFYTSPEHGGWLQAEGFSYSIAPLLEGRDLDAIALDPDRDGVLRLELRNEALETHYINHLGLIAVDHDAEARAVPDDRGSPVGVADERRPIAAVDRAGRRSPLDALMERDGETFSSDRGRIEGATTDDPDDWIDLTFPRPGGGGDDAVLVLRLRNSLLTTVLFYDLMLARAGVGALDWIGNDMSRIGTVVELGRWFQASMGLKVQVLDGHEWRTVGRIPDTGPIAWEETAVRVPTGEEPAVRVRIRFLTDAWRIDQASLGRSAPLRAQTRVPVARMVDDGVLLESGQRERLAHPDDDYLVTYPGTSVDLEFDPPSASPGLQRSYLLTTQGYYTEWIRPKWITGTESGRVFEPGEGTVEELMPLWLSKKDAFEVQFYSSKVPVR